MSALAALMADPRSFPEVERGEFLRKGYTINNPGDLPFFTERDWRSDTFIATLGNDARISLIAANHPGQGAWRRLVKAMLDEGYVITVVGPMRTFEQHLKHSGWKQVYMLHHGLMMNAYRMEPAPL